MESNYGVATAGDSMETNIIISELEKFRDNEETGRILDLINQPWKLVTQGSQYGITGVKRFFGVIFLFASANTIMFLFALVRIYYTGFEFGKLMYALLVLVIGLGIMAFTIHRLYHYVFIDALRVIYSNMSSVFRKISEYVVGKVFDAAKGKADISKSEIAKALDFGMMINEKFQKFPRIIKKGVVFLLNRIPIVGMVMKLKDELLGMTQAEASNRLYDQMNNFIMESIFGNNNTQWVWWLLPANVIGLFLVIHFLIG